MKKAQVTKGLLLGLLLIAAPFFAVNNTNVPPFRALGGAIWLKQGLHYVGDQELSELTDELLRPEKASIVEKISNTTPSCDAVESGFCQKPPDVYAIKRLVTSAVDYVPATPDRKEVIGYCTLCSDGTFSPTCAVGSGACSWHGGVAAYGVESYRMIRGTPEVEAKPAVYSYETRTYWDSPSFYDPNVPDLSEVVGY